MSVSIVLQQNLTAVLVSELLTGSSCTWATCQRTTASHLGTCRKCSLAQLSNSQQACSSPDAAGVCRLYAARGVVDGHGLLHELMADVIEDVSGQGSAGAAAAADSWLTVSSVTSEVCRDNAIGTLSYTCLGPTPSCLQTTHSSKTMLQHCVTTMLHVEYAAFYGKASQHPAAH